MDRSILQSASRIERKFAVSSKCTKRRLMKGTNFYRVHTDRINGVLHLLHYCKHEISPSLSLAATAEATWRQSRSSIFSSWSRESSAIQTLFRIGLLSVHVRKYIEALHDAAASMSCGKVSQTLEMFELLDASSFEHHHAFENIWIFSY